MISFCLKLYKINKELIDNFFWRALQTFGKQGVTLLIFILSAKMLHPYDFGIYNYILAIVFFLIMFGDFGISTASSKYTAEYNQTDKEKLKGIIFNSGLMVFILTIIISIIAVLLGPAYLKDKYVYVVYLLPMIFLVPMTSLYDGVYRGLKKFKSLAIISIAIGLASIIFIYLFIKSYGLIGALISQNLFYLFLLIGLIFGHRDISFKINRDVLKTVGRYSFMIGVATAGYFMFTRITVLILGKFGFISQIAIYEILNKLFSIILLPFMILSNILAPDISADYSKKDYVSLYRKFIKYFKLSALGSIFILLLSLAFIPLISKTFFSEYYSQDFNKIFIPVLLLYLVLIYSSVINNLIVLSPRFAKIDMYLKFGLALLSLPVGILLIQRFGYLAPIYVSAFIILLEIIYLHLTYFYYVRKESA